MPANSNNTRPSLRINGIYMASTGELVSAYDIHDNTYIQNIFLNLWLLPRYHLNGFSCWNAGVKMNDKLPRFTRPPR